MPTEARGSNMTLDGKTSTTFYKDMGQRPAQHDAGPDRVHYQGYSRSDNCQWGTDLDQARNKREG